MGLLLLVVVVGCGFVVVTCARDLPASIVMWVVCVVSVVCVSVSGWVGVWVCVWLGLVWCVVW